MKLISRQDAKALGLSRYFTGVPCKRGHTAERYTNGCKCVQCAVEDAETSNSVDSRKRWVAKNRQYLRDYHKRWRDENQHKVREYRERNKAKRLALDKYKKQGELYVCIQQTIHSSTATTTSR